MLATSLYVLTVLAIICLIGWLLSDKKQTHHFVGLAPILKAEGISFPEKEPEEPKQLEEPPLLTSYEPTEEIKIDPPVPEEVLSLSGNSPRPELVYYHQNKPSRIMEMLPSFQQIRQNYNKSKHQLGKNCGLNEYLCRLTMETIFAKPFVSCRPDFLRSTRTGAPLELDGFNQELALAFEYNGEQHYTFPNRYHKIKEEFLVQVRNDKFKYELCRRLGITLLIIPYTVELEQIPQFIAQLIPPEYDSFRRDLT